MPYYELGGLQELNLVAHPPPPKNRLKKNIKKTLFWKQNKKAKQMTQMTSTSQNGWRKKIYFRNQDDGASIVLDQQKYDEQGE
jgi:hypothetical protein